MEQRKRLLRLCTLPGSVPEYVVGAVLAFARRMPAPSLQKLSSYSSKELKTLTSIRKMLHFGRLSKSTIHRGADCKLLSGVVCMTRGAGQVGWEKGLYLHPLTHPGVHGQQHQI